MRAEKRCISPHQLHNLSVISSNRLSGSTAVFPASIPVHEDYNPQRIFTYFLRGKL